MEMVSFSVGMTRDLLQSLFVIQREKQLKQKKDSHDLLSEAKKEKKSLKRNGIWAGDHKMRMQRKVKGRTYIQRKVAERNSHELTF